MKKQFIRYSGDKTLCRISRNQFGATTHEEAVSK